MIWLALLMAQSVLGPASISRGEKIFAQSCSVGYCHGVAGAAGRGPRLRGRSFDRAYLLKVVREGIPQSAMPGWKDRLSETDIQDVVSYVASLASVTEAAPPANPMPPGVGPAGLPSFKGPKQAERGQRLFFDAERETRCGTCHAVGGRGIPIGPDLTQLASKSPKDIASAIRSQHSRHVLTARLSDGEVFPALRAGQNDQSIRLYDLTTPPPVLRTLLRAEIVSLAPDPNWSHAAVVQHYRDSELADIIAYLRWAALGEKADFRSASDRAADGRR